MNIPDHPDIAKTMATGYPKPEREPSVVHCADCRREISRCEMVFEWDNDILCEDCCRDRINENFTVGEVAKALQIIGRYAEDFAYV